MNQVVEHLNSNFVTEVGNKVLHTAENGKSDQFSLVLKILQRCVLLRIVSLQLDTQATDWELVKAIEPCQTNQKR